MQKQEVLTQETKMIVSVTDSVHHHCRDEVYEDDLHRLGVRRLYCGPSRRMIRPRRTKLAATSGVGAIMSVTALCHCQQETGQKVHNIRTV